MATVSRLWFTDFFLEIKSWYGFSYGFVDFVVLNLLNVALSKTSFESIFVVYYTSHPTVAYASCTYKLQSAPPPPFPKKSIGYAPMDLKILSLERNPRL